MGQQVQTEQWPDPSPARVPCGAALALPVLGQSPEGCGFPPKEQQGAGLAGVLPATSWLSTAPCSGQNLPPSTDGHTEVSALSRALN